MRIFLLALCAGCVITIWLPVLPDRLTLFFCLFLFIALGPASWLVRKKNKFLLKFFLTLIFLFAGIGLSGWQHHRIQGVIPYQWQGGMVKVEGIITDLPVYEKGLWKFEFSRLKIRGKPVDGNLRLSWYDSGKKLASGQRWVLHIRINRPHGTVNPGNYELESWLRQHHVIGTGYVIKTLPVYYKGISLWNIDYWRDRLGQYVSASLKGQDINLLQGLLLGRKKAITPEDWELFNRTGTTHLLVISGLHIGLMFFAGYALVNGLRFTRLLPLKRIAMPRLGVLAGLLLSFIYAFIAGFSIPVQRALTMLVCGCAGRIFDFTPRASTVWLVAMATVLIIDPLAAISSGFWYSFIAVASLLLLLGNRAGQWPWWKKWWLPQWSVFIALFPWMLWYQQSSTLYSPLINMVSIPFIGLLVVPLLFFGTGIALIFKSFTWPLLLANTLLNGWRDLLYKVSIWTESTVVSTQGIGNIVIFFLCVIGVIYILLPRGLGVRGFSLPCLLLIWFPNIKKIPENTAEITLLDVKRTQVALVRTHQHTLIYDLGDKTKHPYFNSAKGALLPYLRKQHIKEVDVWMLPRGLSQEAAGTQIQRTIKVNRIFSSGKNPASGHPNCQHPISWTWDGVLFTLIPDKKTCILKVISGNQKALLTGTLSSAKAQTLAREKPDLLHSDVWFVPSLSPYLGENTAFIEAISPKYIALSQSSLIKADKQRLMLANIPHLKLFRHKVMATADTGAQCYRISDSGEIEASSARKSRKYWWRYTVNPS